MQKKTSSKISKAAILCVLALLTATLSECGHGVSPVVLKLDPLPMAAVPPVEYTVTFDLPDVSTNIVGVKGHNPGNIKGREWEGYHIDLK